MAKSAAQVAAWAKGQKDRNTRGWLGLCQKFCRMAAGAPGSPPGASDAITAWHRAKYRHTKGTPPRGSFVFWSGHAHGHVAISAGDGWIYSNDIVQNGHIDRVKLTRVREKWGLHYLGWTEDNNGVRVSGLSPNKPAPGGGGGTVPTKDVRKNITDAWYHVDPAKVSTGLNWYGKTWKKRGVRPRNFNVHVVAITTHNGHKYATTDAGNHYRLDYLAKGRH